MALLRSRTRLGTILKQSIIVDNTVHVGLYLGPHTLLRRNASTARLKPALKTTGKGKVPQTPSPKTTRKTPSSRVQKTQSPAPPEINSSTKAPTPENATEPEKPATDPPTAKAYQNMSEEERERELQRMLQMSELMPTMDLFGQEINSTLGVFREVLVPSSHGLVIQGRCYDSLSKG